MPDITNIPAPRVPFIDERTGLISREWFRFLNNQFRLTGSGTTDASLADLEITPALAATVEDMLPVVETQVAALQAAPPTYPPLPARNFGAFCDTTRQTAAAINTAYAVTFNTTDGAYGTYRGSPTSRIYVNSAGYYDFQFSLQIDKTSGGAALFYVWARVNGTDIANSMSHFRIKDNDSEVVPAWNFVLPLAAGQYFELMWATTSTDVILETFAATAFGPAAPSAILTVTQVTL